MTGQLIGSGDGAGADARCSECGALAVGPCARCRKPVCGNCCVLTTHGARPWAICLSCEQRVGRSLGGAWGSLVGWSLVFLAAFALALVALQSWLGSG